MTITYQLLDNDGLTRCLLSKHLDHGFYQTFLLEARLLGKDPHSFGKEEIEKRCGDLTDITRRFVIALDGEKLAGVLAVSPTDPREIQMLWVEETYRKGHVGTRLVDIFARSVHFPLKVECLRGNVDALEFYGKLGFEFVDKARFPTNLVGYTKVKFK